MEDYGCPYCIYEAGSEEKLENHIEQKHKHRHTTLTEDVENAGGYMSKGMY